MTAGWHLLHADRYKIYLVGQPALPALLGTLAEMIKKIDFVEYLHNRFDALF